MYNSDKLIKQKKIFILGTIFNFYTNCITSHKICYFIKKNKINFYAMIILIII